MTPAATLGVAGGGGAFATPSELLRSLIDYFKCGHYVYQKKDPAARADPPPGGRRILKIEDVIVVLSFRTITQ